MSERWTKSLPLYSINPSLRKRFIKKFIRERLCHHLRQHFLAYLGNHRLCCCTSPTGPHWLPCSTLDCAKAAEFIGLSSPPSNVIEVKRATSDFFFLESNIEVQVTKRQIKSSRRTEPNLSLLGLRRIQD